MYVGSTTLWLGPMPAALRNSKTRKHETRSKSVAATLLNHLLNDIFRRSEPCAVGRSTKRDGVCIER